MRKQYKIFNHTLEFDKTELICIYAFTGFAILDGIALGLIGLIELLVRQQMTYKEIYKECIESGMTPYEADDTATYFEGISRKSLQALVNAVTKQDKKDEEK